MSDSNPPDVKKTRERRLIIAAVAMFVVALSVFGGLFYLQRQATTIRPGFRQAEVTPQQRQAHLETVKLMREKWRPWALQHKELLRSMLKAGPNDQAILMKVYDAVPSVPRANDGGLDIKFLRSGGVLFTWQALGKGAQQSKDPVIRAKQQAGGRAIAGRMRKNFADKRDIELSVSETAYPKLSFWASGRITEWQFVDVNNPRRPPTEGPHKEILPPYDFLK